MNSGYDRQAKSFSCQGFSFVYNNYRDDYDWFMKADDDTYVVVENIRWLAGGLTMYVTDTC